MIQKIRGENHIKIANCKNKKKSSSEQLIARVQLIAQQKDFITCNKLIITYHKTI